MTENAQRRITSLSATVTGRSPRLLLLASSRQSLQELNLAGVVEVVGRDAP